MDILTDIEIENIAFDSNSTVDGDNLIMNYVIKNKGDMKIIPYFEIKEEVKVK